MSLLEPPATDVEPGEDEEEAGEDARGRDRAEPREGNRESLLIGLAELCWLSELYGPVTPRMWHELARSDTARRVAERQFERMKVRLAKHHVPHERLEVIEDRVPCVGIRMLVGRYDLERFFPDPREANQPPKKRCPDCGQELPPDLEHFSSDRTRADGLTLYCRECRRRRAKTHYKLKGGKRMKQAWSRTKRGQRAIRRYRKSAKGKATRRRIVEREKRICPRRHALQCALYRDMCAGKIQRPRACQNDACRAEGSTFAHWADPIRDPSKVMFLCSECAHVAREEQKKSGLYAEITAWRKRRGGRPGRSDS